MHGLLSLLHCLDDQAVDRCEAAGDDTASPFESEEVVFVLLEDQTRALDREGNSVALAILGRGRTGTDLSGNLDTGRGGHEPSPLGLIVPADAGAT